MIVCLAANPSIDRLFEIQRLQPGSIHRPLDFKAVPGGKGLNVARAAVALGGEVSVLTLLAGHAGQWIDDALGAEGIERRLAWMDGETRSSLSVFDRETSRLTEFYEAGPAAGADGWEQFSAGLRELLAGAQSAWAGGWMTISGSLPRGAPEDGYATVIESARAVGLRSGLDARGPALASALGAGPDVVKINAAEAAELVGGPCGTRAEVLAAGHQLRRRAGGDGRGAVITRGTAGVLSVAPDGSGWEGRLASWGPYSVGSGDAFLAGLVVALGRDSPWPRALAEGMAAGAANAEQPGAGCLDRERALELVELAEVERLTDAV
ncbi:MAG: PfkB family carbohydrate kinase [Actinomycetota bacterium]|nr:PfkB family carbohydrate kinase [Actinomycetota bacterium]